MAHDHCKGADQGVLKGFSYFLGKENLHMKGLFLFSLK
jgi:hypothetical protein